MGLFQDLGEFFTGKREQRAEGRQTAALDTAQSAAQAGQNVQKAGQAQLGSADQALVGQANVATGLADRYQTGAAQSMGANAQDYMQRANAAAQGQAAQAAQAGSLAAARNQLAAARSAGLNRGQAALQAGRATGDAYTQQYQQGLESGRNQYQAAASQFGQMGTQQQQLAQQAQTTRANLGAQQVGMGLQAQTGGAQAAGQIAGQQAQQASNSSAGGGGFLGGIVKGIGDFFSDENLKDNITPSNDIDALISKVKVGDAPQMSPLEELVAKVRPVNFNYKPESGEDPTKDRVGILAQDLEKTSMKDNVIDTPQGKMVDAGQQTLSNTNLIVQLAQELFAVKDELNRLKGTK